MKWVAFIIVLAGIAPVSNWLRRNSDKAPLIWMLVGFLPVALGTFHLYFAMVSWAEWPGYVKGAEFSVLDALAIAIYFTLPATRDPLPFRFSMALYFLAVLISAFQAGAPIAALFYPWQLARMFLLYAVTCRACAADPRVAPALLKGMTAALVLEAGFAMWDRFGLGLAQAGGTLGHQNTLGLASHLMIFPCFALLLAGERRGWFLVALLSGILVELLTASRATIGLACIGYPAVFVLSALRRWTSRKAIVLSIGIAASIAILPIALSLVDQRNEAQFVSSDDERIEFNAAASAILSDHPLGVGTNNYVITAATQGYYQRAGITWSNYLAIVHNVYWLTAAETGYFGLITFVLFLSRPLIVAFRCGWRNRNDVRGDMLLGLGVALFIVYIHCGFEWVFLTYGPQYIFTLDLAMVAGLAQQLGYWRRRDLQQVQLRVGVPSILSAGTESPIPTGVYSSRRIKPHEIVLGPTGDRASGSGRR